jgi:hypothetical protein
MRGGADRYAEQRIRSQKKWGRNPTAPFRSPTWSAPKLYTERPDLLKLS